MITKTLPAVSTILTGSYSIMDLIRDSMSISPLRLFTGGVIEFETPEMLTCLMVIWKATTRKAL